MMKMNILKNGFQALIIVSLMAACSLGDVLEPSDGVNMALMETVDTVVAIPGDTISFKFIASTNGQLYVVLKSWKKAMISMN